MGYRPVVQEAADHWLDQAAAQSIAARPSPVEACVDGETLPTSSRPVIGKIARLLANDGRASIFDRPRLKVEAQWWCLFSCARLS